MNKITICSLLLALSMLYAGNLSANEVGAAEVKSAQTAAAAEKAEAAEKAAEKAEAAEKAAEKKIEKKAEKKAEDGRFKVCVLDFISIDTEGQKRFLDHKNRPIQIPAMSSLTLNDSESMCRIMQGWVRLADAEDMARTNEANRQAQIEDNQFDREKALALYHKVVNGPARPMVIGADYLEAYLGRYSDVFSCVDSDIVLKAMDKLRRDKNFPKNYLRKLAVQSGATHLIYGTVSDIRSAEKKFKGYGIETQTLVFELDVIIKMVDLVAQGTVYSNVYTGSYRVQRPVSEVPLSNDIFQKLMQSALAEAADDFYSVCKPGRKNKIKVTAMPESSK